MGREQNHHILIVEDNATMREGIEQVVTQLGLPFSSHDSAEAALEREFETLPEIVVADYKLPGINGIELLKRMKQLAPNCQFILVTAYGTIELAVEAMQLGANDFITKPFTADEISLKIKKIIKQLEQSRRLERLEEQNLYLREQEESFYNFGEIVGDSPAMQEIYRLIRKVAPTNSTVMIYGESGTGKELVARAIHKNSNRSEQPFVRVHCGALVESLLESELFGHEKGAFTGAVKRRRGRFELADGGTIFLDEIGEVSPALQVRLLRVLQEQEFERVGGETTIEVNTRIIAATNRDLKAEVESGQFRDDLFYRLHIVPISMPPLRQHMEDMPALVDHFIKKISKEIGKPNLMIEPDALEQLQHYHWPGNIRELENIIERAAVLCEDETITVTDLPPLTMDRSAVLALPEGELDLNKTLEEVERTMIVRALQKAHGKKSEAAKILGIKSTTLLYKISKYELDDDS